MARGTFKTPELEAKSKRTESQLTLFKRPTGSCTILTLSRAFLGWLINQKQLEIHRTESALLTFLRKHFLARCESDQQAYWSVPLIETLGSCVACYGLQVTSGIRARAGSWFQPAFWGHALRLPWPHFKHLQMYSSQNQPTFIASSLPLEKSRKDLLQES